MRKVVKYFSLLLIVLYFILSYQYYDIDGMMSAVFFMLIYNIVFVLFNLKKRMLLGAFQITFATFLLGQVIASKLSNVSYFKDNFLLMAEGIKVHIITCLFLSLFAVFIGYAVFEHPHRLLLDRKRFNTAYIKKLQEVSRIVSYLCLPAAILTVLEKIIFVSAFSYGDYYTDFQSYLPSFVWQLATFYEFALFLFLATMPKLKECKFQLLLFFILGCMSLGYGQRNGFVLNLLFILIYAIIRQQANLYNEIWINRKRILIGLLAIPFILIFLYAYGFSRNDQVAENYGWFNNVLAFFYQQGGSVKVIGYERIYATQFPSDFPYSLGYFVDLYQQNPLFRICNVYPSYNTHTIEMAMYGHNFGETLTYLDNPSAYLAGMGLGSCYIAEIYHDFGYVGVFLINFFYGILFALIFKFLGRNIWSIFFLFLILRRVLYAPRADALGVFAIVFSVSIWAFILAMHFWTKNSCHSK